MSKEYRYQKFLRWGQYIIPVFYGILIVLPWLVMFFVLFQKMGGIEPLWSHIYWSPLPVLYPLVMLLFFFSFFSFLMGVLAWYFYWRMAGVCISLNGESIIYKYRRGEKRIPFDNISHLKFFSFPYLGGWIKIISKDHTIRLTVALENISNFLQELKTALDQRGLSDVYDRAKFFSFLKTAVVVEQSGTRLYTIFWKLILITIVAGGIGFIFAMLSHYGIQGMKFWIIISALWPTVIYLASEIIFAWRIAKKSVKESFSCPPPDPVYERIVYRKAILIGTALYLGVSIVVLVLLLFLR